MTDLTQAISQGATNAWLLIPTAVVLGALHGLEPGHSKTMMAAFIIAIRGTILQAMLLGLAAAFSHSLVIWALAAVTLKYGSHWNAETTEPYFQIASGVLIAALALWMLWRTRRDEKARMAHEHGHTHGEDHGHTHTHSHAHEHGGEHLHSSHEHEHEHEHKHKHKHKHKHEHPHPHPHGHGHEHDLGGEKVKAVFQDAHEAAHAREIEERFANRQVTTGQIVLFGLTGGLLPCPAAFTILLLCLQVKQFTLGFTLVASFSIGLALTLVTVGAVAAWSVRHAQRRFQSSGKWLRKAPYLSSTLLLALAVYMAWHGWRGLHP